MLSSTNWIDSSDYKYEIALSELGKMVKLYSFMCFTPITIIGNFIVFSIYRSKDLKKLSISFYYCANTIIDTLYMIIQLSYHLQCNFCLHTMSTHLCQFYEISERSLASISAFISMMAAIDRLRFIVYSSKYKLMENLWFQLVTIFFIVFILTGCFWPYGMHFIFDKSECYVDPTVSSNYKIIYIILISIFPTVIIILCSIKLIVSIKKSKLKSRLTIKSPLSHTRLAKNILAFNFLFCTTDTVATIERIFLIIVRSYFQQTFRKNFGKIFLIRDILISIQLINFMCPIFVHLLTNKIFLSVINDNLKKFLNLSFIRHIRNQVSFFK